MRARTPRSPTASRYRLRVTFEEPTEPAEPTALGAVRTPVRTPVLTVVRHDADVPLDLFADWLGGVEIRTVRAWAREAVPT